MNWKSVWGKIKYKAHKAGIYPLYELCDIV